MRITAGQFKNKKVQAPPTVKTRPTTDEIREAVFNILGPIEGFKVLDCYAGSGIIGFEALSRGAASVAAIEKSRLAAKTISQNAQHLDLEERYKLYRQSVEEWLHGQGSKTGEYDLIFADPPFAEVNQDVIKSLTSCLQPKGLLIVRTQYKLPIVGIAGMEVVKNRRYGESIVSFYKYE